ncbi:pleckstrin homology domain-containing family G member 3-like isoform X1 [Genypterus blacodes]|uniref:pleckstrin homology domain-containing family G member 3-like isoform X1 n=1 Tax=Genypterus blacodes TaxID=154954 RepID=UPI003F777702
MPEGFHTVLDQGPMGEESPQLSSALSSSEHDHTGPDSGPDCDSRLSVEPLDGDGERPVSLVSTLSSGSSRDSHSLFGSTVTLPSSSTPPIHSEEDIDLELSPAEGTTVQPGGQSPDFGVSKDCWQDQLEPNMVSRQWNNNTAAFSRKGSGGIPHTPTSPVVTEAMAPNPKLTYVDRVVMEIIETERMYVKDLRSIVEDYLAHIIDRGNLPIRPEQVCALFGNIEDIYEFNSELLQSLDMCDSDPVAIARCFVDKSEDFEIYTQYCTNYPNSVAALTDCMRSKTLAKFFRDRQAALKRSLPLGSYLLKPVQRILKYHLLLQEIAKHFDPDESGYEVVQEAIDTMTGVAWYINDMKRKHEHAVRVQEIQSLLINWKGPDLTTYGELVLEGTFHVQRAKNTRTLFLFERMLLITKKRGEHYVYKTHILCSTLMLLDSAKDPLLFSVIHFKHPKQPHTVQAKSMEEKRLWAHHIKRLILENHSTIVPQRAKEAIMENSLYPGRYRYSPERLKRTESCKTQNFHLGGRNGRRRSEPAKQSTRNTKAVMKHADSEGALLGGRRSLQPATRGSTLACGLDEPQAESPCVEDLRPRGESLEQLSPTDSDPKLGPSPGEGGPGVDKAEEAKAEEQEEEEEEESYKEDILMGDDQADQNREAAEVQTTAMEEEEALCQEEEEEEELREQVEKEAVSTQVDVGEPSPPDCVPPAETKDQPEERYSQSPASPISSSQSQGDESPEPEEASSKETGDEEGESDSSGLQVEDTSTLTNEELSEEEEEMFSGNKSILPSSVLDQAGVIAEHFISSLSRRSSLVSEEMRSLACPSPTTDNEVFEKKPEASDSSFPELQVTREADLSATPHQPVPDALEEVERRSTLSKQDQILIHKIRRYYEHAEDQDANFSIKRRESLSYIPAGLVRHLSRQLDSIPQEPAGPVSRRSPSSNRPTSWSVFDLPGLEKSQNTQTDISEPQRSVEAKARSQSLSEASPADEDFRPSSEMLKIWQDIEKEMEVSKDIEESREVQQVEEEKLQDSSFDVAEEEEDVSLDMSEIKTSEEPTQSVEEPELSTGSAPTTPTAQGGSDLDSKSCNTTEPHERSRATGSPLPKMINFRSSMDEDQIVQDMGKVKSKVFQLARQYSQRIKNNRPVVRQRSRETTSQQVSRNMPALQEERPQRRNKGKAALRLALNTYDHAIIHEVRSPSPVPTPSSGSSSQATCPFPQSPQSETFHWPDVQELRSKYTPPILDPVSPSTSKLPHSCTVPVRLQDCCTNGYSSCERNGCSDGYGSSSDLHRAQTDSTETPSDMVHNRRSPAVEDWLQLQTQPQLQPLLCRWSSLDHMLGSHPLHEVQNLQEPVRTAGQVSVMKLHDRDHHLLQEGLDCTTKRMESKIVRNLREKFQSLSSSS